MYLYHTRMSPEEPAQWLEYGYFNSLNDAFSLVLSVENSHGREYDGSDLQLHWEYQHEWLEIHLDGKPDYVLTDQPVS